MEWLPPLCSGNESSQRKWGKIKKHYIRHFHTHLWGREARVFVHLFLPLYHLKRARKTTATLFSPAEKRMRKKRVCDCNTLILWCLNKQQTHNHWNCTICSCSIWIFNNCGYILKSRTAFVNTLMWEVATNKTLNTKFALKLIGRKSFFDYLLIVHNTLTKQKCQIFTYCSFWYGTAWCCLFYVTVNCQIFVFWTVDRTKQAIWRNQFGNS